MDEAPVSTAIGFLILLVLFFGGGFAGEQLAIALAPGSGLSRLLGFLMLPAAFIAGFVFWAGGAIFVIVRSLTGRGSKLRRGPAEIPPGASGFVWSSLLACLVVGSITAALSAEFAFFPVIGIYAVVGLAYGGVCWRLAKSGWLQFPTE